MQLLALHLDNALKTQPDFLAALETQKASQLDAINEGARIRLWGQFPEIDALKNKIADFMRDTLSANQKPCTYIGSGDFHHISSLLIEITLEHLNEPTTIIHFDNHPDWVKHSSNLHCGSWVNRIAQHNNVAKIITIGVTSNDLNLPESKHANLALLAQGKLELFPYHHAPSLVRNHYGNGPTHQQIGRRIHWQNISEQSDTDFISTLLKRIGTRNVYITVDKDVLHTADAITNWDQGGMRLPQLLTIIKAIGTNHSIIGADVTGDYSTPNYDGDLKTRIFKRAEILLDQPRYKTSPEQTAAINSTSNLALLNTLNEVMV